MTSAVTVTVGSGGLPRILNFGATPTEIASGGQATLVWNVENATKVNSPELEMCGRAAAPR